MVRKIVWLCAAVVGFGMAIERPTSEVQARRRCCNNSGYNDGCCGQRHHRRCGGCNGGCNDGGYGYQQCGYQQQCGACGQHCGYQQCGCQQSCGSQGCGIQQGCGSQGCGVQHSCGPQGCGVQQNSCQCGCSVNGQPAHAAAYGPTPQYDQYGNPIAPQISTPPAPAPGRTTFDQNAAPSAGS